MPTSRSRHTNEGPLHGGRLTAYRGVSCGTTPRTSSDELPVFVSGLPLEPITRSPSGARETGAIGELAGAHACRPPAPGRL